ncbi:MULTISPECIES: EscU/YscU/HrcU family type III secretion system export apparatus switch protein [Anoxybacillus]|uniref:EscU/YscU/HrcU family type III secretion system export apparatus switch protein n=1 Tax=Anoxybacillus TaxID=150247 RepID=UPI0005419BA9|nr:MULTISPECIES: EscU/YscU/HrcU family type III secretion system export apparatus switch protein [Anoxybacillus]KHF30880.1 Flagellar biosynthetic protein FlhB [Anoxybacillus sp. BCO1]MBA2878711.1 flagellar biosynthesis protein [Anoxybacillus ayderensis]MCL6615639.1 EscU/YscU/HrcU family type III secretion system export apparatus switch protein [Anoxybacillus ayderensis]MED0656719.1 EscU/YscU/HrcU family type III secretion system export apparatus switch protein [Anoxybacillus ayderensis]MED0686
MKRKRAVALSYNEQHIAPVVVAKGEGMVAERIIERAKQYDVPIYEDQTLATMLSQLQLNETIPEELYKVVAEVFAFIYQIEKKVEERS